ncbi:hypothetical protein M422DRAFT_254072 [Sphaerobolus stellatus SS14]|uniref:Uncharacterized protein n=1 Tax=Sphaerobolus stellatus (strain SS14) TaxID=990650 RepID=A0A0C9VLJ2_SPHS4|nr:hypothetical protein M422DRAFT_254072 [Sphaerobolus stellatus SS14]
MERAKKGYIRTEDIVEIVQSTEMQELLASRNTKPTISIWTARRWLKQLEWRYGKTKNGMYIDGHQREDVVAYRKGFLECWKEYEKRMILYDNDGNIISTPNGPAVTEVRYKLILVTHDESTYYANDCHKTKWSHSSDKPVPERKGEGASIMISDFLTPEWGRLKDDSDEARVGDAIDIFESRSQGRATGRFMFDNAPSHQKRAPDARSACKMPKGPSENWTHHKNGPNMRPGRLPGGSIQSFYFPTDHPTMPGWFKGMETIIKERRLWPVQGLNAQCPGFKCEAGRTECCCRRLLFCQPDFCDHKSQLEEFINFRGHLCDFYPKLHCELKFIEQYWGAAKWRYRTTQKTNNINEMEQNMIACLDDIPQLQILRYANRSARFIAAYSQGLSGAQAVWANHKYHGHRTLPSEMVREALKALSDD